MWRALSESVCSPASLIELGLLLLLEVKVKPPEEMRGRVDRAGGAPKGDSLGRESRVQMIEAVTSHVAAVNSLLCCVGNVQKALFL